MELRLLLIATCFFWSSLNAGTNTSAKDEHNKEQKDTKNILSQGVAHNESADSLSESSFKDIEEIIKKGKLRVAMYYKDVKPFYFNDSDKSDAKLIGVDADLARLISKAIGAKVEVEFIRTAKSIDDIIKQVKNGEADIAISKLSYTVDRAKNVIYSELPYLTLNVCFLMGRQFIATESLEKVFSHPENKLCAVEGSSHFNLAKEFLPKATLVPAKNADELENFLVNKKCIAYIRDDNEIKKALIKNPSLNLHYQPIILNGKKDDIFIVVDPTKPYLAKFIDKLMFQRVEFKRDLNSIFQQYGDYLK